MGALSWETERRKVMVDGKVYNKCILVNFGEGRTEEFVLAGPSGVTLTKAVKQDGGWLAGEVVGNIPPGPYSPCRGEMEHSIELLRRIGLNPTGYVWTRG